MLSFIDTDNYTPARAAMDVARERTVPGGAIVFDNFTGTSRFRYTRGERIAGPRFRADFRLAAAPDMNPSIPAIRSSSTLRPTRPGSSRSLPKRNCELNRDENDGTWLAAM